MGVDAEMQVLSPLLTDAPQVRRLAYELCAAVGPGAFWLDRERDQHALTLTRRGEVEVSLSGRYYGQGYERGSWPTYGAIMRFFRLRVPDCEIRYGGDSSELIEVFTLEDEIAMWSHWAEHQGRPYRSYFDSGLDDIPRQRCEFCREPMLRNGWGAGYAAFSCYCGHHLTTRDGGKTWETTAAFP